MGLWCVLHLLSPPSSLSPRITFIFPSLLQLTLCPSTSSPSFPPTRSKFSPLPPLLPCPTPPLHLLSYRLATDTSAKPRCTNTHHHTHTHARIENHSPLPLLHDGLGLAATVTVCDCDLRLTCWGYMASPGYLHNAQGERWRKPSENKRGGGGWEREREGWMKRYCWEQSWIR